ncbi:TIR domain-containing protein [Streptomyces sp. NPDC058000]|uniref:toll/interleukin-1 receptor domain-containing protein n=1 Tax=Streptomyces sp. NPDC058000 TaxID=3346299 RepID=UPI0036E6ADA4
MPMTSTTPAGAPGGRRLFVSYARPDSEAVLRLVEVLRALRHAPWVDRELESEGGKPWWDRILAEIEGCDAIVVVLSPQLFDSLPAQREREYAAELGKPPLPVMVEAVTPDILPRELSSRQFVDFTQADPLAGAKLATAVTGLPYAPPLPDPMPKRPDVPSSYLGDLRDRVRSTAQSLDEQIWLITELRRRLDLERERQAVVTLLRELQRRPDLCHAAWQILDPLLRDVSGEPSEVPSPGPGPQEAPATPSAPASPRPEPTTPESDSPPAGWYPDPSGRHQLRWFWNGCWTRQASDDGKVIDDPNF